MKQYYKAYDERYKTIHKQTGLDWAGEEPSYILKDILEKYSATKDSRILEIGCGEGQNSIYLQKENFKVLASDVSNEAITWCKKKAKENKLNENNFFVLDILENNHKEKYDFIYSVSTLHMLVLDNDRKAFFDFLYDHLTDNGIAIITSMGDGNFERNNSDITKAFDLSEREFNNQKIEIASTTCRIVNWNTISKEATNSHLKILEKYTTEEISGFNISMIFILKKDNR